MSERKDMELIAQLVPPGSRVLDLGCGNGELLALLRDTRQCSGYGIEIADDNVLACTRRGVNVIQLNLEEGLAIFEDQSFDVVLQLDTMQRRRDLARAGIRSHAALVAARLDLETLGSPRGFTVRHLREGSLPTYQLAFLMTDYLITRDGFDRTVEYFRGFGKGGGRRDTFKTAFHQTLEQFEAEVLTHLKTIVK